jgi:hypothetical protein
VDSKLPTGLQQNSLTTILDKQIFRKEFKAVAGNSANASDTDIDAYFDKGLTGDQAAALFNSDPRIEASELKNDKSGTVDYDVKTQAGIDSLTAAKNNAFINDKDGKK